MEESFSKDNFFPPIFLGYPVELFPYTTILEEFLKSLPQSAKYFVRNDKSFEAIFVADYIMEKYQTIPKTFKGLEVKPFSTKLLFF